MEGLEIFFSTLKPLPFIQIITNINIANGSSLSSKRHNINIFIMFQ